MHVVPESMFMKQNEFATFKVLVPPGAGNAHIGGKFSVQPVPHAQVDMVLIREAGYQAWRAYPIDDVIYHTGNTSTNKFQIPLGPGNYYLIFDNNLPAEAANTETMNFDANPIRQVDAQIRLIYDRHF